MIMCTCGYEFELRIDQEYTYCQKCKQKHSKIESLPVKNKEFDNSIKEYYDKKYYMVFQDNKVSCFSFKVNSHSIETKSVFYLVRIKISLLNMISIENTEISFNKEMDTLINFRLSDINFSITLLPTMINNLFSFNKIKSYNELTEKEFILCSEKFKNCTLNQYSFLHNNLIKIFKNKVDLCKL